MRPWHVFLSGAFFLISLQSAALAGVVEVRPTTLTITPSQKIAILSLVNPDTRPIVYQVRIYHWRQSGDEQILEPTDDVIASPPIVTLGDHATQVVRVGLRGAIPDNEATYRLILEEVPAPNLPKQPGLNISIRLSLPLFVRTESNLPAAMLSADLQQTGNHANVVIHNNGRFTTRIAEVALNLPDTPKAERPQIKRLTYLLPGNQGSFSFLLPAATPLPHDLMITAQTDDGPTDIAPQFIAEAPRDVPAPPVH